MPRHYWSPLYLTLADSLVSRNGQLGFFHDYLKKAVESEYLDEDRERKKIHGCLGEVALSWNTDKFGPTLRRYGLAYGVWHLRSAGHHEKLWGILRNEHFRAAQLEEFKRVDEIITGLKDGIAMYCQRKGQLQTDDARLAWMALQCGEVVQDSHRKLDHLLQRFLSTPSILLDEIKGTLEHLKSLDDSAFFHACLLLIYRETLQSQKGGTRVSSHFLKFMEQEMALRLDGTIEVVPEVFQEAFTQLLPSEFWASIKSMSRSRNNICEYFEISLQDDFEHLECLPDENSDVEEDAVLADDAMNLAAQKNWSGALEISAQLTNTQSRSDVLYAISRAQSEHGLLNESLSTFAAACTQVSKPSKKDWSSLGGLCVALAAKVNVKEALQLLPTIEDTRVRSVTTARVASLIYAHDKEAAMSQLRVALNEAAQLGQSGYLADAVAEILSAIEHQEVLQALQSEVEKCVEELNYENWRSAGLKALAENQARLGLFNECLKTIQKIPRHNSSAAAYASAGVACYRQEKADDATHLFASSIKAVESCKEDYARAECLVVFGDCLAQVDELHGKSEWLERAVEMAISLPSATEAGASIRSLALASSPSKVTKITTGLKDGGSFWRQFHMNVALAPTLIKVGRARDAHETLEYACRMLQRIEFAMSQRDAADAFDFIIDTCSKMDVDYFGVLGNVGLDLAELAISGYDSNYLGLVKLMLKHKKYEQAVVMVSEIATSANRVKALSRAVSVITRNTQPNYKMVELIQSAIHSQDDWKFLLNINWTGVHAESSAEWIRYFISLHPESSPISRKLVTDLIAANVLAGNRYAAQQICMLCPELGLTDLPFRGCEESEAVIS
jgi:tetratricopeptide (TPR) repeat protein